MPTLTSLWKLAFSRQNSGLAGRLRTLEILVRIHVLAKFRSTKGLIQLPLEGFTVSGYSYATLLELYTDIFIKQVYRFETKEPKPFIVDCGANIGMSVLYFKRLYPDSEVWAYEANPEAFALLEQNIAANKIQGVHLFNYVLASADGSVDFYIPTATAGLNGSLDPTIAKGNKQHLPCRRLSGLLPHNRPVDFIKIDIEGAEFDVLTDLRQSGRLETIRQAVVELHASSHHIQQKYTDLTSTFGPAYKHSAVGDQHTEGIPQVVRFWKTTASTR